MVTNNIAFASAPAHRVQDFKHNLADAKKKTLKEHLAVLPNANDMQQKGILQPLVFRNETIGINEKMCLQRSKEPPQLVTSLGGYKKNNEIGIIYKTDSGKEQPIMPGDADMYDVMGKKSLTKKVKEEMKYVQIAKKMGITDELGLYISTIEEEKQKEDKHKSYIKLLRDRINLVEERNSSLRKQLEKKKLKFNPPSNPA